MIFDRPRGGLRRAALAWCAAAGCGPSMGSSSEVTRGSTSGTGEPTTSASTKATTMMVTSSGSAGTTEATGSSSGGAAGCAKKVVLMGYWPPTNEMLRPWSTNVAQNPGGWVGENWGGYGYDVYAYFPEFPPDGDPSNDAIGAPGAVGSPDFDLRVDYQATSADFWRIVDEQQPRILLTTSRGGEIGWEIEALEGGHGLENPGGPEKDWASDGSGADKFPTQATVEARTWAAISMFRQGKTLPSQLPVDEILAATQGLGVATVAIDTGTSGNFLSGFLALHGLYYNKTTPGNVAAGHIHVGLGLPVADASALLEATLRVVLQQHPADGIDCG